MKESTCVESPSPQGARDVLTEILRQGAQQLLKQAVRAEMDAHLEAYKGHRLESGHQRVVRQGVRAYPC